MRNIKLLGTATVLFVSLGATSAQAVTRCVNPGGTGSCSATIQGAITAAAAGDTIAIASGIYHADTLPIVVGASLTGLKIAGPSTAIIDPNYRCNASCQSGTTLQIDASNVTVSGLTFRNTPSDAIDVNGDNFTASALKITASSSYGIYFASGADAGIVKGCKIDATQSDAVYASSGLGMTVQSNTFVFNDGEAVYIAGDNAVVTSNKINNTYSSAIEVNGNNAVIQRNVLTSIWSYGIEAYGNNNNVSYNTITDAGAYGIYVSGGNNAPIVSYNKVNNSYSTAIYVYNADNATITHNTVNNSGGYGIYASPTAGGMTISYNTLTNLASTGIFMSGGTGNNVAAFNKITSADSYGIYGNTANNIYDHNTITHTGSTGIYSSGNGAKITYNMITYAHSDGIYATGDALTVSYNKVTPNGESTGIYVTGGNNQTVKYNTVNGGTNGIYVTYTDNPTVTNNTVHDTYDAGIAVYCATYPYNSTTSVCTGGNVSFNKVSRVAYSSGIYIDNYQQSGPSTAQSNTVVGANQTCIGVDNSGGTGSTAGVSLISNHATTCGAYLDSYYGYEVVGSDHTLTSNTAVTTGGPGFYVDAADTTLTSNSSTFARGDGFEIHGATNTLTSNKAVSFTGSGFGLFAGSGTTTLNGNTATGIGVVGLCQSTTATATIGVNNFGSVSAPAPVDCTRTYGYK